MKQEVTPEAQRRGINMGGTNSSKGLENTPIMFDFKLLGGTANRAA